MPASEPGGVGVNPGGATTTNGGTDGTGIPTSTPGETGTPTATKKQFYGTVTLDPIKAKMDFATIMDEVVQQFTSRLGVDVRISVEIQAQNKDGFDETLQRIIKENCNVLKFNSSEFENGDE